MLNELSRRAFLSDAALVSTASALKLHSATHASLVPSPPRRANFDQDWRFLLGDPQDAYSPAFMDAAWNPVQLPHDWSIEGAFSEDAPAKGNGAYLPTGIGWYRKSFTLPTSAAGKQVELEFDGVYQRSEVWINGVSLGMRPYGFISFAYDLTPHLAPHGRPNHVAVRVDNSLQPNCRWYSGSGIYRHTWLRIVNPLHIARSGVYITTPLVSAHNAHIEFATVVHNQGNIPVSFDLLTEIVDAGGTVVQQTATSHDLAGSTEDTFDGSMVVASPSLWSPTSPSLYQARSTLRQHGAAVDQETTIFGIREAVFDVNLGLLLNGEHVKMNGVCIHGDGGSVGTAVPERVWERRLMLLREMGCNAIRLSHNPPAPELLDMLDRIGFLVMDEAFDEWKHAKGQTPQYGYHRYFDEWSERDLTAMIKRDRNHPSIVLWSIGNEIPDQIAPEGTATLARLKEIVQRYDKTRPITAACDEIAAEPKAVPPEFLAELDVVGYNYVDRWRDRREKYYSIDRHDYPQRRFVGTESSAPHGARGVYGVDQRDDLFFERVPNTLVEVEQLQKFIQTYDYVSGDFIWTGIDYLGEARWPNKLGSTGPLDTCGFKKDAFFLYQSLWTSEPVLHLLPHWNWHGMEGKTMQVSCFTNCDTVELFLNGQSLGVQGYAFPRPGMTQHYGQYPPRARALQTTADLHLKWDVPYAPGSLTALGVRDGKVVKTCKVQTTGPAAKLTLSADRSHIHIAPFDVAHVTVRVTDGENRTMPTANDSIRFTLQGEGRILGVDNGKPDSHEPYKASVREAFNGLALVILQSNGRPGTMLLSASAQRLGSAQIEIATST